MNEHDLIITYWIEYKFYGAIQHTGRLHGTHADMDANKEVLANTPGVADIKLDWER